MGLGGGGSPPPWQPEEVPVAVDVPGSSRLYRRSNFIMGCAHISASTKTDRPRARPRICSMSSGYVFDPARILLSNINMIDHTTLIFTVICREIETAVPDERVLVLFVPYILLTRSYNIKVNIFGLNEVKIEIDSPGAALCTCLVPNLYSLRYPK